MAVVETKIDTKFNGTFRNVQVFISLISQYDSEPWVGADGLDMYPQLEGGIGSMRAMLPM